jgi:hypothetical protein
MSVLSAVPSPSFALSASNLDLWAFFAFHELPGGAGAAEGVAD